MRLRSLIELRFLARGYDLDCDVDVVGGAVTPPQQQQQQQHHHQPTIVATNIILNNSTMHTANANGTRNNTVAIASISYTTYSDNISAINNTGNTYKTITHTT